MEIGTAEVALGFSGIVCLIGVLTYATSVRDHSKADQDERLRDLKAAHQKDLETREWRAEARGLMNRHSEDLGELKSEQQELRQEVRENSVRIQELADHHRADMERVDDRVDDLRDVMRGDAELDAEERTDKKK